MPGDNCSIYGCETSRSRKNKGISIFKLPAPTIAFNKEWRSKLLNIVTKYREIDENLKRQIDGDTVHICQKHFTDDQICFCK